MAAMADDGGLRGDSAQSTTDAAALAEQAEAEAAAAEALAAAARSRARAIRLRHRADAAADAVGTDTSPVDTSPAEAELAQRQLRKPRVVTALVAAAIVSICALLGASGYITVQHHGAVQQRQRAAAFIAAAKQGVVNMMSLDFHHAEDDVQRMLDSSTGQFRDDFEGKAADFITMAKQFQVVSEGSVGLAAIESMDKDSAMLLVSAISRVTNSAGAKAEPRAWRLRVTVTKDGDQVKMSKLMYVP